MLIIVVGNFQKIQFFFLFYSYMFILTNDIDVSFIVRRQNNLLFKENYGRT